MVMASVSGHLMELDFSEEYKGWRRHAPTALFNAPLRYAVSQNSLNIAKTLRREAQGVPLLVIWTDNDREGEAIGEEIVSVCKQTHENLVVKRAQFAVANAANLWQALNNLRNLNDREVAAVQARSEIDLRIGSAFTRFQTLHLQAEFGLQHDVVSFGPCQFPTLGFVVARAEEIRTFVPEDFWTIKLAYLSEDGCEGCDFLWSRGRIFDHLTTFILYEICMDLGKALVESVTRRPKSKWRPLPLATVEMQIRLSRYRRMSSERVMHVAEALYNRGIISYPRTETDSFTDTFDLQALVQVQAQHAVWGGYANNLLNGNGFQMPRQGRNSDQAHPPIHPTAAVDLNTLNQEERTVYEFIVRHFLACCSRDARGSESAVTVSVGPETFSTKGIQILERNYLDIYMYESWTQRSLPNFQEGQVFVPSVFEMQQGRTVPPRYLTEAELIRLMDHHGIGTDATIQDHIKTIQKRDYARKIGQQGVARFRPEPLGYALVLAYKRIGYEQEISRPFQRARMERDFRAICNGEKTKEDVVRDFVTRYHQIYNATLNRLPILNQSVRDNMQQFNQFQNQNLDAGDGDDNNDHGEGGGSSGGRAASAATGLRGQKNRVLEMLKRTSRLRKKSFARCGKCNAVAFDLYQHSVEGRPGPRGGKLKVVKSSLYCQNCSTGHELPNGHVEASEHECFLCKSQVVKVTSNSGKSYFACPRCYTDFPRSAEKDQMQGGAIADIEESFLQKTVPCFECSESRCPLSGRIRGDDVDVVACFACTNGNHLRLKKFSGGDKPVRFSLVCQEKTCREKLWLSSSITKASPAPEEKKCTACNARKLIMDFKPRTLPLGFHSPLLCCVQPDCKLRTSDLDVLFGTAFRVDFVSSSASSSKAAPMENSFKVKQVTGQPAPSSEGMKCFKCNQPGHFACSCPNQGSQNNSSSSSTLKCFKCGGSGHFANNCSDDTPSAAAAAFSFNAPLLRTANSCFKCGKSGHFAHSCPENVSSFSNQGTGTGRRSKKRPRPKKVRKCNDCGLALEPRKRRCRNCKP